MSYTKITDLSVKDVLLTGNPAKIIKGAELNAEFDAIAAADAINVKGPVGSSTDNAIVRWDTATGRAVQDSSVTVSDTGVVAAYDFDGAVGTTTTHPGKFTTLKADSTTDLWGVVNAIAGVNVSTGAPTSTVSTGELNINSPASGNGIEVNGDNGGNISFYNNAVLSGTITAGAGATYLKLDSSTGTGFRLQTDVSAYLGAIRGFVTGAEKIRVDASGLNVYGGASVSGNLSSSGSLTVGTSANIGTDITVGGASSVGSETVRGNLTVLGTLTATGMNTGTNESLVALANTIHSGTIVKAIIYDTSKDSDGGAWRKRCTDKSWYTEALGFTGTWGGQAANVAAGWAACGSVVGGAYQSTADNKFYTPTSSTTQTEIFRGNAREFPEQVAIVAEAARVVIYDLTQVGTPIWMVFKGVANNIFSEATASSVASLNGIVLIGDSTHDLHVANFISDSGFRYSTAGISGSYKGNISFRNSGLGWNTNSSTAIVNRQVNDVALTVLDTAPIDPATGLPVPTIAVFTAGGTSIIQNSGTVVNSASTVSVYQGAITPSSLFWANSNSQILYASNPGSLGVSFAVGTLTTATAPALLGPTSKVQQASGKVSASTSGLTVFRENPATFGSSMVSYITNTYNTGWLPGDIRGAYLADTTAETITASGELVTNGTFTTDTSGWTVVISAPHSGGIISVVTGALRVQNDATGTNYGSASTPITCVVGKSYSVNYTRVGGTGSGYVNIGTGTTAALLGNVVSANNTGTVNFVATATTMYVNCQAGTSAASIYYDFDNISVKLADPDRSVKNTGLVLNGSLTKTAVASGAGLVAYSGFSSAVNYLSQPYTANLDFGTGDFSAMVWVNVTSTSGQYVFIRGSGASGTVALYFATTWGYFCSATGASTDSGVPVSLGLHHVCLLRVSGVLYLYLDGVQVYTVANTANVTNTAATLFLGQAMNLTTPLLGSMALWRISATAPSADQIAHIYRTELPLFQANAKCTIDGTSTAVTALGYDDVADTLHVGTSWGRTSFRDLLRVDSEATTVGAVTSVSANEGAVITGGATTGKFAQPAMKFRDELRRKDIARKALGKIPVPFDYTATASQTAFVLPKGYITKTFQKNGTFVRENSGSPNFVRSDDGFQETCTLSAGATVGDWIQIMAVRK